ncbi:MAG: prephenate dehydrogenase, partial [Actinomycetota bacterium]|nr:prephenate dehydrogenase [Actinomycetota bacterium]
MTEPTQAVLSGPVHVVGAGLLGTSIGLACRRSGVPVWLSDTSHEHV